MKEERNYIVYKHISPSNKIYIGITKQSLKQRWKNGKGYAKNEYFTNAIKKYGQENFKHEILYSHLTLKEAKELEIKTIAYYDSTNREKGYNITIGGDPCNKGLTEQQKKENKRIWLNKWRKEHPDIARERSRIFEERNREKRHEQANKRNKSEARRKHRTEYMKKYRELNREKIRKINQKSYRKRKENEKIYNTD